MKVNVTRWPLQYPGAQKYIYVSHTSAHAIDDDGGPGMGPIGAMEVDKLLACQLSGQTGCEGGAYNVA